MRIYWVAFFVLLLSGCTLHRQFVAAVDAESKAIRKSVAEEFTKTLQEATR
jgi:hypothetical protein